MLILASSSPRRQQLLVKITATFKIIEPLLNEDDVVSSDSALPLEIAKMKAYQVFHQHPKDIVLACDTIVYFKQKKYGKPLNNQDAFNMLSCLMGHTHKVITGYVLIGPNFEINRNVVTKVTFKKVSDEILWNYIHSGAPIGKSGSYGIQDENFPLYDHVEGSIYNVMGLPIEDIQKMINKLKITL